MKSVIDVVEGGTRPRNMGIDEIDWIVTESGESGAETVILFLLKIPSHKGWNVPIDASANIEPGVMKWSDSVNPIVALIRLRWEPHSQWNGTIQLDQVLDGLLLPLLPEESVPIL